MFSNWRKADLDLILKRNSLQSGQWNRLLREGVEAPSLEEINWRLDGTLESGLVEGVPIHGRRWNKIIFRVLLNPNHSVILWKHVWENWKNPLASFSTVQTRCSFGWFCSPGSSKVPNHSQPCGECLLSTNPIIFHSFCLSLWISECVAERKPGLHSSGPSLTTGWRTKLWPMLPRGFWNFLSSLVNPLWIPKVNVNHLIPPFLSGPSPYLACVCAGNVSRADVFWPSVLQQTHHLPDLFRTSLSPDVLCIHDEEEM